MTYQFILHRNEKIFLRDGISHTHDSFEIILSMSDCATFYVEDVAIPLRKGMLILIPENTPHYGLKDQHMVDSYTLRITPETLDQLSSLQTDIKSILFHANVSTILSQENFDRLSALLENCTLHGNGFGEDFLRESDFLQIMYLIGDILRKEGMTAVAKSESASLKIQPVLDYIHKHYAEELSLESISEHFYVSKYHLSHIFKESTGVTLHTYLTNYRIQEACKLLLSGVSVQDTGAMVGFANNSHFVRIFGKIIGVSPGKYAQNEITLKE